MTITNSTEEKGKIFNEAITGILYYYDVAGLSKYGVPEDEYTSEASAIIYSLKDVDNLRSLHWAVYDVFVKFLSKESILPAGDECYRSIAEEVWELWQEKIQAQ